MSQPHFTPRSRTKSFIVIPARLASTRLPRKLLLRETGKSLIQHTYEAASRATLACGVCVATDHEEILAEVRGFGGQVANDQPHGRQRHRPRGRNRRRSPGHRHLRQRAGRRAGARRRVDRSGHPAAGRQSGDVDVHAGHADSPPRAVRGSGLREGRLRRARPGVVLQPQPDSARPRLGRCAAERPTRRISSSTWASTPIAATFFSKLAQMPPSPLEQLEKLEQLRVLEAGHPIVVGVVDEPTFGIDTPRGLSGVCPTGAGTLRCGSRVRRPWSHARAQVRAVSPEMSGTFDRQIALPLRRRGRSKVPDTFRQPASRGFPLLKPIPIPLS